MISVFDMYTIGIGPSSSHTVGPMKAAYVFCQSFNKQLADVHRIQVYLHGSLAHTGIGHGTNHAILLGLSGFVPDQVEPESAREAVDAIIKSHQLNVLGERSIGFSIGDDLCFDYEHLLPEHSNGMRFVAYRQDGSVLAEEIIYSIGGGFIYRPEYDDPQSSIGDNSNVPYPFTTGAELLATCEDSGLSIAGVQMANEQELHAVDTVNEYLDGLVDAMEHCIDRGCHTEGLLSGKLKVKRRAPELYQKLLRQGSSDQSSNMLNWVNVFAMAVNEENAAGGRIVTAPTNGAAGILPAVLAYYRRFHQDDSQQSAHKYLLTAAASGSLFKMKASISGAEMGCQGEVGVACSMAAGALAAVFGGTPKQVEQAAEIGIEHNLGLTCDPVDGLVQIPCIERNAMGSMKAINAAHLAMAESGDHKITLDMAINSMREIGENMNSIYKETSKGGLAVAVNVIEC